MGLLAERSRTARRRKAQPETSAWGELATGNLALSSSLTPESSPARRQLWGSPSSLTQRFCSAQSNLGICLSPTRHPSHSPSLSQVPTQLSTTGCESLAFSHSSDDSSDQQQHLGEQCARAERTKGPRDNAPRARSARSKQTGRTTDLITLATREEYSDNNNKPEARTEPPSAVASRELKAALEASETVIGRELPEIRSALELLCASRSPSASVAQPESPGGLMKLSQLDSWVAQDELTAALEKYAHRKSPVAVSRAIGRRNSPKSSPIALPVLPPPPPSDVWNRVNRQACDALRALALRSQQCGLAAVLVVSGAGSDQWVDRAELQVSSRLTYY